MLVVTGAAGFLGGHVVAQAADDGRPTCTVDRRHPVDGQVDVLVDLAEPGDQLAALSEMFAAATAVVHLAGAAGVRARGAGIAERRRRDNVLATRTVLALTPPAVPVVVTSSSSVYGGAASLGRPSREADPPRPLGGYARSKIAVEQDCARRRDRGGRITIVRPFSVIGRGQRADMALARWVAEAMTGAPLTVYGSLHRTRDFTDVATTARALLALADLAPQTVVNLGSGRAITLGTVTTAVARMLGDTGIHTVAATANEPDHTLADVRRCQRLLGFTPTSPDLDAVVSAIAADGGATRAIDGRASA
jgi:nucleoside-diphosphate-sugar epimerase